MKNIFAILLIFIASCTNSNTQLKNTQNKDDTNIYKLNIAKLEFIYPEQPKIEYPHFEYLLPIQIPSIVENWFDKHINITNSGDLIAKIIIKEASAIEFDGNNLEDHDNQVTTDSNLYKLNLSTRIEIININNPTQILDYIDSEVFQTIAVNKKTPVEEYTNIFADLINNLTLDFNKQMSEAIPIYFKNILTY
jgi:hypothetical protein